MTFMRTSITNGDSVSYRRQDPCVSRQACFLEVVRGAAHYNAHRGIPEFLVVGEHLTRALRAGLLFWRISGRVPICRRFPSC